MSMKKFRWIWTLILMLFLLSGCGAREEEQETVTVRFQVGEVALRSERLEPGDCPRTPKLEVAGGTLAYWIDMEGEAVVPGEIPAEEDVVYRAVVYPELSAHAAYLFPDEDGKLRPDDILTFEELRQALLALQGEASAVWFPELPEGDGRVTAGALSHWLEKFFTQEEVAAAAANIPAGDVCRGSFAVVMNRLLGRSNERLIIGSDVLLYPDVPLFREDLEDLLEAAVPHMPLNIGNMGKTWEETLYSLEMEPGFFHIQGWLYCVDEDGHLVHDAQVGTLEFTSEGHYTSTDAELDEIVAGLLVTFQEENPEMTREELLKVAYLYCRDTFYYLRREYWDVGSTGWEPYSAKLMLTTEMGNCYNYSAAFWALARGLGYDARCVSGRVRAFAVPHGWAEIDFDGVTYIFDPELETVIRSEGRYVSFFKMTLYRASEFRYLRY